MISAPPAEATSNELADWLELEVLSSVGGVSPLVSVNLNLEIGEDTEPDELDEENLVAERRLQQIVAAVDERVSVMGTGYPFRIDADGTVLQLFEELTFDRCAYLFCLIVSNGAKDGLLSGEGAGKPDLTAARGLFDICATVSAAGFVEGPSFCTGWPRPQSVPFLDKLRGVYGQFGDGVVHAQMPAGAPDHVKDDEIDVIAWKQPVIAPAGSIYFLGQAASGANWSEKSLKGRVDAFHGTWFSVQPASQVRVGTITPFVLPTSADAGDHEEQAEVAGRLRREILIHGDIIFRHLVTRFVTRATEIAASIAGPIERLGEMELLCDYVRAYRQQLQLAIATGTQ